ncbi:MAG: glycosyltransferase family 2 protein [Rivularia sp. T60_A2020_040]|nr:glycosyltransferase family 2 protein [Rivularia sp. T60_A2020_040]
MSQLNPYRPSILPVSPEVKRPLWSVMIPTYNCAEYLRYTLKSILAQDPGVDQMQIVVVDNHSTEDNPEAVVKELGADRIEFYRQTSNVGMMNNFQTCFELSRGKLIHLMCSDDGVREGFYQKMAQPFEKHPELGAAFCRSIAIDQYNQWQGLSDFEMPTSGILPKKWLHRIAELCCISVPSLAVVRREVYENLGGFDRRCGISGDWEMWVRIFSHYPMWFEAEPLAMWRVHLNSANNVNAKSNVFIQENYHTVETILNSYFSQENNHKLARTAKQNCAFLALESADFLIIKGDIPGAMLQLKTALKYSKSYKVVRSASRILLWNRTISILQKVVKSDGYNTSIEI